MKSITFIAAVITGVVTAAACTSSLPHANEQHAEWAAQRWPGVGIAELEQGRNLYVQNCSGCHMLRDPKSQPPDKWPEDVEEMRVKMGGRLSEADAELIERYLITMSATAGMDG